MKNKKTLKPILTKAMIHDIADKSFGHVLDCVLGYSDSYYNLQTETTEFSQNFEEDMQEIGIAPTERRLRAIESEYDRIKAKFVKMVRRQYYDKHSYKIALRRVSRKKNEK